MANRVSFLSLSDPRGDVDLVARTLDLARQKDVRSDGVFLLGNLAGPLLSAAETFALDTSRRALERDLKVNEHQYRKEGVDSIHRLLLKIARDPQAHRGTPAVQAAQTFRSLVGTRDEHGAFVQFGVAAKKARAVYAQLAKAVARSKVPVFVMADTIFAEELIPEASWLHFSWVSLSGYSFRCLGASELEDRDAIPEYFLGPRRGGKLVRAETYPVAGADILFAYVLSPVLHELLSTSQRKLVVMCGNGGLDMGYEKNTVATQKGGVAYDYTLDGARLVRRCFDYDGRGFGEPRLDDLDGHSTSARTRRRVRKAEIETQVRLAGLGKDLITLTDLIKQEDPDLADQISRADNRAEAIFRYIQYLERERTALRQALSADRAGLERILNKIAPYLGADHAQRLFNLLRQRPDTTDVEEMDAANETVAIFLETVLKETVGEPPSGQGAPAADAGEVST